MSGSMTVFTAGAIAHFAFQVFLKTQPNEVLSDKFSEHAISKMGELRHVIETQLTEKSATAASALEQAKAGDEQAIRIVANFLDVEMMMDETFSETLQQLAQAVHSGKIRR